MIVNNEILRKKSENFFKTLGTLSINFVDGGAFGRELSQAFKGN